MIVCRILTVIYTDYNTSQDNLKNVTHIKH